MTWDDLDARLAAVPGTASVYAGRLDAAPTWTHAEHAPHYAASTMKVAVLAALYRAAEAGALDPDTPVPVHNDFPSAHPDGPRFSLTPTTTTTTPSGTASTAPPRCAGSPNA